MWIMFRETWQILLHFTAETLQAPSVSYIDQKGLEMLVTALTSATEQKILQLCERQTSPNMAICLDAVLL